MSSDTHHTRCPQCHTVFRVNDAQLAAADGKVRCGQCKTVFYAPAWFTDLADDTHAADSDDALPDGGAALDTTQPSYPGSERFAAEGDDSAADYADLPLEDIELTDLDTSPWESETTDSEHFDLSGTTEAGADTTIPDDTELTTDRWEVPAHDEIPAVESGVSALGGESPSTLTGESEASEAAPSAGIDVEAYDAADETAEATAAAREEAAEPDADEDATVGEAAAEIDENAVSAPTTADDEAEHIPYVLRESLAAAAEKPRSLVARVGILLLVLLLTVLLAAQAIYFRGLDIAQHFPAARPLVNLICGQLDCPYTGPRDVHRIRLVNRDIRAAQDRGGVLVITATMVNEAEFAQPFPIFEVVLSDLTGTSVAERRFLPEEYLGSLVKEQFLMQPGQPVQVTLEVVDPGSDAVNFEINFL